jgi:S-DNA-T family DNA segregation ATPase FtsK/SpoIIIE
MSRLFKKFKTDIMGIFLVGLGLFISFALMTYNPADPSLNSLGHNLKITNACGIVGSFLADALFQLFGLTGWILALGLLRLATISFQGGTFSIRNIRWIWGSLLILTLSSLFSVYLPTTKLYQNQIPIGGLLGLGLSKALIQALNVTGVQIVLWSLTAILVVFFSEKTVHELARGPVRLWKTLMDWSLRAKVSKFLLSVKKLAPKPEEKPKAELIAQESEKNEDRQQFFSFEPPKTDLEEVKPDLSDVQSSESSSAPRRKVTMKTHVPRRVEHWELPKLSLLEDPPMMRTRIDEKEIRGKIKILTDKLAIFNVTGEVSAAKPGPAVTMFEFRPTADVKVSKITELEDDLSLALSSESLRILAPIPGRDVVGIETSNTQRETVYLKDLLADENFWKEDFKLPIALGKQADGAPKIVDLRKMPHLMVAGTTGSGKSVFTVSVITGLIFKHSPKTLRLILIDPKQVDLAAFSQIPHLIMPPVGDSRQAVSALRWAVKEMEKRYKSMQKFSARGLEQFNETVSNLSKDQIEYHEKENLELESNPARKLERYYSTPLPYLVIVIEEFADLMSVDKANVETLIVRLAQKARACGIHLLLAMQSPRKEVVTGLIKTNIPGRIAFKVNSGTDSRIILDEAGAERLLAQGDMLFKNPGGPSSVRHHGPFLKDSEISAVAKFWSDQAEPEFDQSAIKALEGQAVSDGDLGFDGERGFEEYDDRYDEILSWVSTQKEVSASLVQRRFQLGYPRAARIVETFEREGVVGPANGAKPRQVLVNNFENL